MRNDLCVRSGELIQGLFEALVKARSDWTEWELSVLAQYSYYLKQEYHRYLRYQRRRPRHLSEVPLHRDERVDRLAQDLKSRGAIAMPIDPDSKQTLRAEANPFVLQLRALDARKPNSLVATPIRPSSHRHFWKLLHAASERFGLKRIAERYFRYPLQLTAVGLQFMLINFI